MSNQSFILYVRNDCELVKAKMFRSLTEMLEEAKVYAESGVDCWMRKIGQDKYFLRYYKANKVVVEVL